MRKGGAGTTFNSTMDAESSVFFVSESLNPRIYFRVTSLLAYKCVRARRFHARQTKAQARRVCWVRGLYLPGVRPAAT